ncbi:hypothetical protein OH76DRAFT_360506 [Lentinus brumalis]|uniref:Uncharacterized protein n=1 Tax=Lentinus brumalis TaxID=2498619 RepID=A0A371CJ86_9APHY|nr:hypothetical protein OH76DRAFT_360506 [Polyporus brumalis]
MAIPPASSDRLASRSRCVYSRSFSRSPAPMPRRYTPFCLVRFLAAPRTSISRIRRPSRQHAGAFYSFLAQRPRGTSYKLQAFATSSQHILKIPLLILCVRSCPAERMESMGPALEVLAMLTSSPNIGLRCAIAWIFSVLGPTPSSAAQLRSSGAGQVHLPHLAASRARPGGESTLIKQCAPNSLTLVQRLAKDGEFCRFGIGIADVLMRGPPTYNDQDIPNIPFASSGSNRPRTWRHLLQKAAAAHQSVPSLLDKADLFDLEYLALTDSTLAASGAQEVFASSPAHAYAHILFCEHSLDRGAPLQIARRGLELDGLTPYLKRRMLFRVVELSYEKAFAILLEMNFSHHHMILGLTYACSVFDDASGDCRNLPRVGDLSISKYHKSELGEDLGDVPTLTAMLDRS